MKALRLRIRLTLVLGGLTLVAILMSHLALTDIFHGEGDLTQEWAFVQFGFVIIVAFLVLSCFALMNFLSYLNGSNKEKQ